VAVNHRGAALLAAARRAEQARWELACWGGSGFGSALGLVDRAWVSPSPVRSQFGERLVGVGSAVLGALGHQGADFQHRAAVEPVEVDPQDPVQGWKADPVQVRARAGRAGRGSPGGW
jgi:hypothetical protein